MANFMVKIFITFLSFFMIFLSDLCYAKGVDKDIWKIYCFVDEAGQDSGSAVFVVVALILIENPSGLRNFLEQIEKKSKIGLLKWHKATNKQRMDFLSLIMDVFNFKYKI